MTAKLKRVISTDPMASYIRHLTVYRIKRNTAGVSIASKLCTKKAINPEIGALTQHQDAALENAGALNKAITLELAKQLVLK